MKIRLRLILAFFLLAVVPLTGLVLYSYYASLQAVRQSQEEEAIATIGELERRMEETRVGLATSFQRIASRSSQPILLEADESGVPSFERSIEQVMRELGDNAVLLGGFRVSPESPEAPAPPGEPTPPDAPEVGDVEGMEIRDQIFILSDSADSPIQSLDLQGQVDIDLEALKQHEELGQLARAFAGGIQTLQSLGAIPEDFDGAEGTAEMWGQPFSYRLEWSEDSDATLRWESFLAAGEKGEGSEEGENPSAAESADEIGADGSRDARVAQRQEEQAAQRQQIREHRARRQAELQAERQRLRAEQVERREARPLHTDGGPLLDLPIDIPLRQGDKLMAKMRPEIRADALLQRVLQRTDRDQGEVPFALDGNGQLFVADDLDHEVLSELDLSTLGSPDLQYVGKQPWVVATLQEQEGDDFVFGIARPIGEPMAEVQRTAKRNFLYGLGLIGLALFGIVPLSRRISRDLLTVTHGAERIAAGELDTRVPVRSDDEIGQLASTFNSMAQQLAEHEARREEDECRRRDEALARQQLEAVVHRKSQELEEARQFQLSLLPKRMPEHPNFEMAVDIRTATEVGGDYYDYRQDGDALTLAIGDATGHGAKAGTMVTVTKSLFSAYRPRSGPSAFLQEANATIRRMDLGRMSMALSVAELCPERLTLAAAGMPPVLLYRAATGQVEELSLPGLPLGSRLQCKYKTLDVELQPGDTFLLTTDGIPELLSDNNPASDDVFGYERLKATFEQVASKSPQEIVDALCDAIDDWRGGGPPNDDVTVMVVERR